MKLHDSPAPARCPRTWGCAGPAWPSSRCWHPPGRTSCRLQFVDSQLAGKDYLLGDTFSVADADRYVVTRRTRPMRIDTACYPDPMAHRARVEARPAVQEALRMEKLVA